LDKKLEEENQRLRQQIA